jgi:hypothetical protein
LDQSFTFRIKLALLYLFRYCYLIVTDQPIVALGLFGGFIIFLLRQNKKLILKDILSYKHLFIYLLAIGFPLIASIYSPNLRHHGRYTMPFIPFYTLLGFLGIKNMIRRFELRFWKVHIATKMSLLFITLGYVLISLLTWASTFGWNVKNINDLHIHLGNWVKENTSRDSIVALNDIGAITYISQRKIIDMVGLVSPDVLEVIGGLSREEREDPLWIYLECKQPDYIIIFPSWYPSISEKENLNEIYRIKLDRYTIIDGEMVVYELMDSENL